MKVVFLYTGCDDLLEEYGLTLIRHPLPFKLDHVNCFIAEGDKGYKIIDAGLHNEDIGKRWEQEIQGKTVTDIIITHYHPDHYGYAGVLQQKTGARVSMTKTDTDIGLKMWGKEFLQTLLENYAYCGIPNSKRLDMVGNTKGFIKLVTPHPEVTQYLQEGEILQIGRLEYEVIYTPGHSDGLISLYNKEKRILISTDHILPKITPNISYWFHGDPNPLKSYLQSLEKIEELDIELAIPSHGDPFQEVNKRIGEIKNHHDKRLNFILEQLQKEMTVYQLSKVLFPRINSVHEIRFAIGETMAHLEYLRFSGHCDRELIDGIYRYNAL